MTRIPIELVRKYNRPGPRYTSYPTALEFQPGFDEQALVSKLNEHYEETNRPLSLYFHLPFCQQVCYFCACNAIYTRHRDRAHPYVANVLREIELLSEHVNPDREVTQLHWGGGTPTFLLPELMRELQMKTREHFKFAADAEISVEVDPREASDAHLETLREVGFNRMSMGVQDFQEDVQIAVNRLQPFDLVAGRVEKGRKLDFDSINLDLMYGLPLQTLASMSDTLEKTISLRPDRIAFFNYAYLPKLKTHMRRIVPGELPEAEVKLAMLEQAVDMLTAAGYRYIGMDHFVLPDDELAIADDNGSLHRNFQGYTTREGADLYGLGVTSISDHSDAYSQNVRTEAQYAARIEAGRLPVERGVKLKHDDLLRREVIMMLINRFAVDLTQIGADFGVDGSSYFQHELQALQPFADDGLVEVEGTRVRVTDPGRFLIRNICMTFDAYLASKDEATSRFSRTV